MNLRLVIIALFSLCCLESVAQEVLHQPDIIRMVNSGYSEELILMSITSKKNDFDMNSMDRIDELMHAGVPQKIITAMMEASTDPARKAVDLSDPLAPHNPGIYYRDRNGRLAEFLPSNLLQSKTRGTYASRVSGGIAKVREVARMPGERSTNVFNPVPKLYFYFSNQGANVKPTAYSFFGFQTALSPREFLLARMEAKGGARELEVASANNYTSEQGLDEANIIPFEVNQLATGIFEVTLPSLPPGEYCILHSGMSNWEPQQQKIYDFGTNGGGSTTSTYQAPPPPPVAVPVPVPTSTGQARPAEAAPVVQPTVPPPSAPPTSRPQEAAPKAVVVETPPPPVEATEPATEARPQASLPSPPPPQPVAQESRSMTAPTPNATPSAQTESEPAAVDTPFNTSVSPGTERPARSAAPVLAPRPKVIAMVTKKNVDDLNLLVDSLWKAAQENERLVWEHSARITSLTDEINAYAKRFMWQEDRREELAIRYKQCCAGGGSASPQTLVGVPSGNAPLPVGMATAYTVLHAFSDAAALDTFRIMTTKAQVPQHFLEIISAAGRRIYKEEVFTGDIKLSGKPHEGTAAEWDALRLRGMLSPWAFSKPMPTLLYQQFVDRARNGLYFEVEEAQVEALLKDPTAVSFSIEPEPGHARLLAFDRATGKVVDLAPIEP